MHTIWQPSAEADQRDRIAADYTLVTYPDVGHDIQLEVPDRVTATMRWWLAAH